MKNIPKYKGGSLFLGHASEFSSNNQFDFLKNLGSKGDILKFRLGLGSVIFISNPKYLKHILQRNYKNYKKDYFYHKANNIKIFQTLKKQVLGQ